MKLSEFFELSRELEKYHSVFYKLWDIGEPDFSEDIPTACVGFDKKGNCIRFIINPIFWDGLTLTQQAFVISHECLHVIFEHGRRMKDSPNKEICNIAMDIVINELLLSFGFKREEIDKKGDFCWFDKFFDITKENIERNQSFEYYYNRLLDKAIIVPYILVDDHSLLEDFGDTKDIFDAIGSGLSDEEKSKLNNKLSESNESKEAGNLIAGDGFLMPKIENKKVTWLQFIKYTGQKFVKKDISDYETWIRANRRIALLPEDIIIPSDHVNFDAPEKKKPSIYVFIDVSGSCYELKRRFWAVVSSIPQKFFTIQAYSFDSITYKIDLKERKLYGGGGTSFWILEERIRKDINNKITPKYPELVFVLTDGFGDTLKPLHPTRWHWLLSDYCTTEYIPATSHYHKISKFEE